VRQEGLKDADELSLRMADLKKEILLNLERRKTLRQEGRPLESAIDASTGTGGS